MHKLPALALASVVIAAFCANFAVSSDSITQKSTEQTHKVLLMDQVEWGHLNPARGDQSPSTGTLWGDRTESAEFEPDTSRHEKNI